jgi:signal peptidase I
VTMGVREEGSRSGHRSPLWVDAGLGVLIALVLGLLLKTFVLGAVYVPSASMEGTLLPGDYILVNKLGFSAEFVIPGLFTASHHRAVQTPQLRHVRIGDIVLFRPPAGVMPGIQRGDLFFVKRCIAAGGDTVRFQSGGITVNRRPLLLPGTAALQGTPESGFAAYEGQWLVVPERSLYLLGDNPSESHDSRVWGCVPERDVVGTAAMIYWSISPLRTSGGRREQPGAIRWNRIGTIVR